MCGTKRNSEAVSINVPPNWWQKVMDLGLKHGTIINHDSRERGLVIWVKASCLMRFTHCRDLQAAFLSAVKNPFLMKFEFNIEKVNISNNVENI